MSDTRTDAPRTQVPITQDIVTITPNLAAAWLDEVGGAEANWRRTRWQVVTRYSADMAAGRWQLTGDPIRWDETGRLVDGFHRLLAVIDSGATITVATIRGIPINAVDAMDTGLKRRISDSVLRHHPDLRSKDLAVAAAKLVIAWRQGVAHNKALVDATPAESILEFIGADVAHMNQAAAMSRLGYEGCGKGGAPSAWAAVAYEAMIVDPNAALAFFHTIRSGAGLTERDPRLALRNWTNHQKVARNADLNKAEVYLRHIVAVWNTWRQGKSMAKMNPNRDLSAPIPRLV